MLRVSSTCSVLLLLFPSLVASLEARWTPAADGGPARFSKRYRDAQGIDDSRWYASSGSDSHEWWPSLFPQSAEGWLVALAAAVGIALLYQQQQHTQPPPGQRAGGPTTERDRMAQEAAREAFLRKYGR